MGMKKVLLISVLLGFMVTVTGASALTVENVSLSETGGMVVSSDAQATGGTSADAEVRSTIRTEGSNTRVRVDIQTEVDGVVEATSSERTFGTGRLEVRIPASSQTAEPVTANADISAEATTTTSSSRFLSAWENVKATLSRFYKLLFFFW